MSDNRLWGVSNEHAGIRTDFIKLSCANCREHFEYWLDEGKSSLEPILLTSHDEVNAGQECPVCGCVNYAGNVYGGIKAYNIYEN